MMVDPFLELRRDNEQAWDEFMRNAVIASEVDRLRRRLALLEEIEAHLREEGGESIGE